MSVTFTNLNIEHDCFFINSFFDCRILRIFSESVKVNTDTQHIIRHMRRSAAPQKCLVSEVVTFMKLCLIVPAINVIKERLGISMPICTHVLI